ncbi:MAG TPA: beta-phosphoglucomutase family hydrolase [Caulobacteraceae bacterium]|jgi:beta-phosphoglucomutase family hydrolase
MAASGDAAQTEAPQASGAAPAAIDPIRFEAAVFDLDGVLTGTAEIHAEAWKRLFDDFLAKQAAASGKPLQPFDPKRDYLAYVDGRPRSDGVRTFLAARGITVPEGEAGDPPDAVTVRSLGARKDAYFLERLAKSGVKVFADAQPLLANLRAAGLKTALVSSSRNAKAVLEAGGLTALLDVVVDGVEAARLGLKGKPAPDTFQRALQQLGVQAARAVGFEDALVGVEAIRAAGYGLVVGVDRVGQSHELVAHGADVAVSDLTTLQVVAAEPASAPHLAAWPPVAPTEDAAWLVVEDGFTLAREHEIESVFAVGNGHLGSRASLAEGGPMSSPATFVAGLFDTRPGPTPSLAPLPDWSHLAPIVEGAPLKLGSGKLLSQRRTLDMRQGLVWRDWRHEDPGGRVTRFQECRLASLYDRRLLLQSAALTAENYTGAVGFETRLDASVEIRTSGGGLAAVSAAALVGGTPDLPAHAAPIGELTLQAQTGRTHRIDRFVAVGASSQDASPRAVADAHVAAAQGQGMSELIARHRDAWAARWEASDIRVDGDPAAQRALRFAAYHLISAADPTDARVSIGARAMTGGAYSGHVFWDTEIYMLPFFALTWPEAARALLMYRHHTLPAARKKALSHGARGAFYAWESADTGDDVTPASVIGPGGVVIQIRLAQQEQHISADVAFGAWSYWRATGDDVFLLEAGAEIIIETARFWASRAEPGDDGRLHIRGVVGPDEYHEHVDDDAYTNGMARWNLRTAVAVVQEMATRWPESWAGLRAQLKLGDAELDEWADAARDLYFSIDPRSGLIEQFQGYFALKDLPLTSLVSRSVPVDVLLGLDRVMRTPIIKQPDVLMLIYLLWDEFTPQVREANFHYYEARCAQGSSLSPCIHALFAARLGRMDMAQRYFRQASGIDLSDNRGDAAGGVHAAALGGLWQAAVFGFAGLTLDDDGPQLDPKLPPGWRELSFRIRWRGKDYALTAQAPTAPVREISP